MIENEGYQHCQHFRCIKEHRATEFTWFERILDSIYNRCILRSVSEKCMERKVWFVWDFDLPVLGNSSTYRADTLQEASRIITLLENFKTQKNIRLNLQPMHTSISFRKMYGAQSVVCMGL
jgi:hypothetical protein